MALADSDAGVRALQRPDPALMKLYALRALSTGPGIVVTLPILAFRYLSLRYRFDADGVSMKWGVLFRREVDLAYDRIQDIHLSADFIERWLGLGTVSVQTASGSATPEMTLEGLRNADAVRDFLYARARGARDGAKAAADAVAQAGDAEGPAAAAAAGPSAEASALLRQIADDLRATRLALASSPPAAGPAPSPPAAGDVP